MASVMSVIKEDGNGGKVSMARISAFMIVAVNLFISVKSVLMGKDPVDIGVNWMFLAAGLYGIGKAITAYQNVKNPQVHTSSPAPVQPSEPQEPQG